MNTKTNYPNIYYPPGGILIWIIVVVEVVTFASALLVFLNDRGTNPEVFNDSQAILNKSLGTINTLLLVTGGFFMSTCINKLKTGKQSESLYWITGAIGMGFLFLMVKGYEYYEKLTHGYSIDYNDFFMYYWLLTGFHYFHVLAGVIILIFLLVDIKLGRATQSNCEDLETGGIFWHMCDLIWLMLFPVLYLLH